jgi:hypothetical protein
MMTVLAAAARAEQKVDVFVNNGECLPFATLQRAEALASRLFATADVLIAWHSAGGSGRKGRNRVIIIKLQIDTPAAYHPSALGYSLPYERIHVSIFYGRIRQMDQQSLEFCLLGHVLVHEITHLLQGTARHSTAGVMKARWDSGDFLEMKRHLLSFTPDDIELIRNAEYRPVTQVAKAP